MVTSNPAAIYTARPRPDLSDFDTTYMSKSVVSLTGFEPEDFIGHTKVWYDRVHPDDLRRSFAELALLWEDGQHAFEYRFLHKDGSWRWIREEDKVIPDSKGKPFEVIGYYIDLTERKQAEEARSRLASIVESSDDAIVGYTLEGVITSWNRAAERTYGYSADEVTTDPFPFFTHQMRKASCHRYLRESREEKEFNSTRLSACAVTAR